MKLCVDCKHYKPNWKECAHPRLVDRVSGRSVPAAQLRYYGVCGEAAKFFEPANVEATATASQTQAPTK